MGHEKCVCVGRFMCVLLDRFRHDVESGAVKLLVGSRRKETTCTGYFGKGKVQVDRNDHQNKV